MLTIEEGSRTESHPLAPGADLELDWPEQAVLAAGFGGACTP